jgi:hypothetical protein
LAFGLFRHSNFATSSSNDAFGGAMNYGVDERRYGVYTNITLDYSDYLFLNLSARNDWTSTVEQENRSENFKKLAYYFGRNNAGPSRKNKNPDIEYPNIAYQNIAYFYM